VRAMVLTKLALNLMVEDVNRTVEFYQEVLGFEFVRGVIEELQEILTTYQQDRSLDYAMMKCGNVEVMFQAKRSLAEALPLLRGRRLQWLHTDVRRGGVRFGKLKDRGR